MNKKDLIDEMSIRTGYTKKDCLFFIDVFCETIVDALMKDERVKIENFGAFDIKMANSRVCKSFSDNKPLPLPARKIPVFYPSSTLKQVIGGITNDCKKL